MNLSPENISFILLILAILVLLAWCVYLNVKFRKMLAGGLGKDLPETISKIGSKISHLENFEKDTIEFLKNLNKRTRNSPQGIGLVRFNAFKDGGNGGQSFALALIDENGIGVIVSSIYGRGHVGVYSKPISSFTSTFELTDEEKEAIKLAKEKLGLKA